MRGSVSAPSAEIVQQRNEKFPTRLVLSAASECSALALLLFGGALAARGEQRLVVDDWVPALPTQPSRASVPRVEAV